MDYGRDELTSWGHRVKNSYAINLQSVGLCPVLPLGLSDWVAYLSPSTAD